MRGEGGPKPEKGLRNPQYLECGIPHGKFRAKYLKNPSWKALPFLPHAMENAASNEQQAGRGCKKRMTFKGSCCFPLAHVDSPGTFLGSFCPCHKGWSFASLFLLSFRWRPDGHMGLSHHEAFQATKRKLLSQRGCNKG